MSKTGHYRYIDGKWTKVSDKPGVFYDAYVPEGGYVDETLGHQDTATGRWIPAEITSRSQKAHLLRKRGLVEDGGFQKPVRRKFYHA